MKTKIILFTFLFGVIFFQSINLVSQTGWFQLPAPSTTDHLFGIYFKDLTTGIAGSYRTTNSGQTWTTFNYSGYAMVFADQSTGYIVPGVYKTTNTGLNWMQQVSPTSSNLYGISFSGVNTGYACGESAKIIKTTNGGSNWTLLTSPVSSSYYLKGAFLTDPNTIYISGYTTSDFSSVILKTTNGGSNWAVLSFAAGTGYNSIFFISSNTGITIGVGAAKTTNGGVTWVPKTQNVTTFQHSLYFSSVNTGYSTGFSGNIIKTTNGGETWFRQTSGTGSDLESVYFLNDNTGFVCGDDGVVLKTTDGGGPPIGIMPVSNQVPANFLLYQNYPNPFNPTTKIRFDVPAPLIPPERGKLVPITLKIFDVRGREVTELVDFDFYPGTYEVEWDGSNHTTGVYFYTLTAGTYKETKRMVLLK